MRAALLAAASLLFACSPRAMLAPSSVPRPPPVVEEREETPWEFLGDYAGERPRLQAVPIDLASLPRPVPLRLPPGGLVERSLPGVVIGSSTLLHEGALGFAEVGTFITWRGKGGDELGWPALACSLGGTRVAWARWIVVRAGDPVEAMVFGGVFREGRCEVEVVERSVVRPALLWREGGVLAFRTDDEITVIMPAASRLIAARATAFTGPFAIAVMPADDGAEVTVDLEHDAIDGFRNRLAIAGASAKSYLGHTLRFEVLPGARAREGMATMFIQARALAPEGPDGG